MLKGTCLRCIPPALPSDIPSTLYSGVLIKLVLFSASLGIVPISSYFLTDKYVWNGTFGAYISCPRAHVHSLPPCAGNSTYSAITAIVAANIVLVAYIVLSLLEDKQEREGAKVSEKAGESRKER